MAKIDLDIKIDTSELDKAVKLVLSASLACAELSEAFKKFSDALSNVKVNMPENIHTFNFPEYFSNKIEKRNKVE